MSKLQIEGDHIVAAGQPLPAARFPAWVERHPQLQRTLTLEAEGQQLFFSPLSDRRLKAFIRHVCQWGGYPRTADRILEQNPWSQVRQRFERALSTLADPAPRVGYAARQLVEIRHLGLSFASKHLRLLQPAWCPVLDSTLSQRLGYRLRVAAYRRFAADCLQIAAGLERWGVENPVERPEGRWFAADVEMALFVWVKESRRS